MFTTDNNEEEYRKNLIKSLDRELDTLVSADLLGIPVDSYRQLPEEVMDLLPALPKAHEYLEINYPEVFL